MAVKTIAFGQDARDKIKKGVSKLSRTVRITLGPRGRNVILQKSFGSPTVTKDGVTVAKEIDLEDPYENIGARMVREVASKTSDVAGDGTTTATVLAEAIFNEGLRAVVSGVRPVGLKRGIEKAVTDITEKRELRRELEISRRHYKLLFDAVPCCIQIQDRNFRIVETNALFKREFGDRTGEYCYKARKNRDSLCPECPAERALREGKVQMLEEIIPTKNGEPAHMLLHYTPVRNEDGEFDRKEDEDCSRGGREPFSALETKQDGPVVPDDDPEGS